MEVTNPKPERNAANDLADKALLSNGGSRRVADDYQQLQFIEASPGLIKMRTLLRINWPLLLLLWLSHICIGMGSALPGSSLMHLAQQVGTHLGTMGYWFTVKSVTSCLLALVTSFLFFRLPGGSAARVAFLSCGNLASATAMVGAALARNFGLALALSGLLGAGHGALETANGILVIRLFGSQHSRPILHSLHFSTALGGLTAPLVLHAFTAANSNGTAKKTSDAIDNTTTPWNLATCSGKISKNGSAMEPALWGEEGTTVAATLEEPLQLIRPYSILFSLQTTVAIGLLLLAIRRHRLVPFTEVASSHLSARPDATVERTAAVPPLAAWRRGLLIALTVIFYFTAVGGENIFWSWVSVYGICSPILRLDASGAAALNAAFFVGFLVGRGLGVAVSRWARPTIIMLAHLTGCLLALVILCLSAAPWLTYAGTAGFGLCVSVLYATGVTWLEQRLDVVGPVACSWSIGGQLGISVLPAMAGHLLVAPTAGPAVVMQLALGALATAAAAFLLMLLVTSRLTQRMA